MTDIDAVLDHLEKSVTALLSKIEVLEQKNKVLKNELSISVKTNQQQMLSIDVLKVDVENLKLTNSLLGSEDYKRDTKLKINSLVREIDYCIAQLAD